jgi:branched-chain amino acid transport system substrate-binding protein
MNNQYVLNSDELGQVQRQRFQRRVNASLWPLSAAFTALLFSTHAVIAAPELCPAADPIVVGDVSSLSGSLRFPESQRAAKLAFEAVNPHCGIKGHAVDYQILDDAGEPAKAVALTQELVLQRGAVALVGGTSVVSCGVNAAFYASAPVASIPGTGTGPRCFDSPNISPPNSGLFSIVTLALQFAAEHLSPKKICLIGNAHPGIPGNFHDPVERFQHTSGKIATIVNQELSPNSDPDKALEQLEAAGCDVAFVGTLAQFAGRISAALGRTSNHELKLILAPEAYTHEFAAQLAPALTGRLFVVTDTDFFDSNKPGMERVRARLEEGGVELSPFAVGGELAAQIVIDALRRVDGPITRQSVLAALMRISPYDTQGLTAAPYKFTWPENKRFAPGIHVVVLGDHAWRHATEDWIILK